MLKVGSQPAGCQPKHHLAVDLTKQRAAAVPSRVRLARLLKNDWDGQLQHYWGTYGGTNYVTSWDSGWVSKFVPKPGADPSKLIGRRLILQR